MPVPALPEGHLRPPAVDRVRVVVYVVIRVKLNRVLADLI